MKKITKLLLLPLIASSLVSCNQNNGNEEAETNTSYENNEVVMLNDFESNREISYLRVMNANYNNRGTFSLNEDANYVSHGEKSLCCESFVGSTYSFQMFFDDANIPLANRNDFKKLHLDVYSTSDVDMNIVLSINVGDKNDTLLRESFVVEPNKWVSIDFRLSAMALKYNYDKMRGAAISLSLKENKKVYLDNFSLIAGAEFTDEDMANEVTINEIASLIDELPEIFSENDYSKLDTINTKYLSLSDLYRRIVPNYDKFLEKTSDYFNSIVLPKPLESNQPFLASDKVYALSQIEKLNGTNAEFSVVDVPEDEKFDCVESDKWLKIKFFDTANNMFNVKGITDKTVDYETMTTAVYNESDYLLRIWFNYANNAFVDINPNSVSLVELPTIKFNNAQNYWSMHHLIKGGDGTIYADSGACYIAPMILHRMSEEEILSGFEDSYSKLPDPSTLINDASITKALDNINSARFYYEKGNEETKAKISSEKINKLEACEEAVVGYGIIYDSSKLKFAKWSYGENFSSFTDYDENYGNVCKCSFVDDPIHGGEADLREQYVGSMVFYDAEATSKYERFQVSVYNPTEAEVTVTYKDCKWGGPHGVNWNEESANCSMKIPARSWGTLVCDISYLAFNETEYTFVLSFISNAQMTGDFLITSVYGLPAEK